jgi:hypothetical protein
MPSGATNLTSPPAVQELYYVPLYSNCRYLPSSMIVSGNPGGRFCDVNKVLLCQDKTPRRPLIGEEMTAAI